MTIQNKSSNIFNLRYRIVIGDKATTLQARMLSLSLLLLALNIYTRETEEDGLTRSRLQMRNK